MERDKAKMKTRIHNSLCKLNLITDNNSYYYDTYFMHINKIILSSKRDTVYVYDKRFTVYFLDYNIKSNELVNNFEERNYYKCVSFSWPGYFNMIKWGWKEMKCNED